MAYTVTAYIVMAYTVMAYILWPTQLWPTQLWPIYLLEIPSIETQEACMLGGCAWLSPIIIVVHQQHIDALILVIITFVAAVAVELAAKSTVLSRPS